MKKEEISFGNEVTWKWKYIIIDPVAGQPIIYKGKEVGGVLMRCEQWKDGIVCIMVEGIELDPEYRGLGIASYIIRKLMKQCDLMIGCITEDQPKQFWKRMGAEFRPIPLECFPNYMRLTISTADPIYFFITDHPKAREFAETFAREVPEMMRGIPDRVL